MIGNGMPNSHSRIPLPMLILSRHYVTIRMRNVLVAMGVPESRRKVRLPIRHDASHLSIILLRRGSAQCASARDLAPECRQSTHRARRTAGQNRDCWGNHARLGSLGSLTIGKSV